MAAQQRPGNGASSHSLEMANSNQELVSRGGARRWRCLALVVGVGVVLAVLAGIVVLLSQDSASGPPDGSYLTLDDVLKRRFYARPFNASWISDTELYYDNVTGHPLVFDIVTRTARSPFLSNYSLEPQTFQTSRSPDGKYVLEAYFYRALYRHSFRAFYHVIDTKTGVKTPVSVPGPNPDVPALAELVQWGKVGSQLVIVVKNDIFYRPTATSPSKQITFTGQPDTVYNGVPDWVYEEEVLSSNTAAWVSPEGSRLLFATYNDTFTPVMTLPFYGRPGDLNYQYTRALSIRYPKPATPNPIVSLTVVDLESSSSFKLDPPPGLEGRTAPQDPPILALSVWVPDEPVPQVLVVWMNRVQNHAIVQMCSVNSVAKCSTVVDIKESAGWVDLFGDTSMKGGKGGRVVMIASRVVGDDSFKHVARFDPNENASKHDRTDLTDGTFVVSSILGWDQDAGYVYFVSTASDDPARSLVQRVKDSVEGAPHEPECLSCQIPGCLYASAEVSKNFSYCALSCLGPKVPTTHIFQVKGSQNVSKLMDWELNEQISSQVSTLTLPTKKRMSVDLGGGMVAQVMLWLPPGVDLSGRTKYPMLVDVYGGPNSFRVSERFAMDWGTYLSANQSIIYAAIDGRGSANKGDRMVFAIYRKFGVLEVEDQINVTRYLQNHLPYIDEARTAIWGWSYGGYASAMALAKDTSGVFKCGMSVAPVTDWIYYDSVYTERYMGLPTVSDNLEGYSLAALNNKVENLRNKKFFLVHGTLDDNVHYQHSMMLSRALEERDILFQQQSYPDEEHGLVSLQHHLYHTLQNFLAKCFEAV